VPKAFSFNQYLLGVEGLALLRSWLVGDEAFVRRRLDEVSAICARPSPARIVVQEKAAENGYAAWAGSYDDEPNAVMSIADAAMSSALAGISPGRALDVACGTGRQTARLVAAGHRVTGMDASPAMLVQAQKRLPGNEFVVGDVRALPVGAAAVDLVTCTLALAHQDDLAVPVAEISRVLRPAGHAVICDIHPTIVLLGGHAMVALEPGVLGVVRNRHHPHSAYLKAFQRHGLSIVDCREPAFTEDSRISSSVSARLPEAARAAFAGLPAVLLWLVRRDG
jgi:ubiquinone/menaquinone biosynthesis C-methylase UbiE